MATRLVGLDPSGSLPARMRARCWLYEHPEMKLRPRVTGIVSAPEGITNPPIDELLDRTQSKYALLIIAAKRARQINAYYSQLGEGLLEYLRPLVETAPQEKPPPHARRQITSDLVGVQAAH